LGWPTI